MKNTTSIVFGLISILLLSALGHAVYPNPVGFESWNNGTAWGVVYNNHTLKNSYYYQNGLSSVSNVPGEYWSKRSWGVTWGNSWQELLDNRLEVSNLSSWATAVETDNVQFVNVLASKRVSVANRNFTLVKSARLTSYPAANSINETYWLSMTGGSQTPALWAYQRDSNIDVGGDNDQADVLHVGWLGGGEQVVNLSAVTSTLIFDGGSLQFARLYYEDVNSGENMDFAVENKSAWKVFVIPGSPQAQVVFAVQAGVFSAGVTKSLETWWTDAEWRPGCAVSVTGVQWSTNTSSPTTESAVQMGCKYSTSAPSMQTCAVYWDYFENSSAVPGEYRRLTSSYNANGSVNNSVPRLLDGSLNPVNFTSGSWQYKTVALGVQDKSFESAQSWGGCWVSGFSNYSWMWNASDVLAPNVSNITGVSPLGSSVYVSYQGCDNTNVNRVELYSDYEGVWQRVYQQTSTGLNYCIGENVTLSGVDTGCWKFGLLTVDTAGNGTWSANVSSCNSRATAANQLREYYYAGDELVAQGIPASNGQSTEVLYEHPDYLGSVRRITDGQSTPVVFSSTDFAPFGQQFNVQGSASRFTFTGTERDASSNLQYMKARFYDPSNGRFLGVDSEITVESPYSYAANNPFKFFDPDGRAVKFVLKPGTSQNNLNLIESWYRDADIRKFVGWTPSLENAGLVVIMRKLNNPNSLGMFKYGSGKVVSDSLLINARYFSNSDFDEAKLRAVFVHELYHWTHRNDQPAVARIHSAFALVENNKRNGKSISDISTTFGEMRNYFKQQLIREQEAYSLQLKYIEFLSQLGAYDATHLYELHQGWQNSLWNQPHAHDADFDNLNRLQGLLPDSTHLLLDVSKYPSGGLIFKLPSQ